jgi:hypothetical protein
MRVPRVFAHTTIGPRPSSKNDHLNRVSDGCPLTRALSMGGTCCLLRVAWPRPELDVQLLGLELVGAVVLMKVCRFNDDLIFFTRLTIL